jgi:hypothetical protein
MAVHTAALNTRKFHILASESISVIAEDGRANSNYCVYTNSWLGFITQRVSIYCTVRIEYLVFRE